MEGIASEKVPGGKLVRIQVDYNGKINNVKITGDFFIHPEETISDIENSLSGIDVNQDESFISNFIQEFVTSKNIQLIGITPDAIARVLKSAIK